MQLLEVLEKNHSLPNNLIYIAETYTRARFDIALVSRHVDSCRIYSHPVPQDEPGTEVFASCTRLRNGPWNNLRSTRGIAQNPVSWGKILPSNYD